MASAGASWMGAAPAPAAPAPAMLNPQESDEFGLQVRPMGVKVHYTFDKDGQVHCLARWPQILQIQTIPIDDRNTIGVVDLRLCLKAITQCSPELAGQPDLDYTVYAYDYSEPDTPLVGQGMLSWALDPTSANVDPSSRQLVTGRVTKNVLAIFRNGIRETLEVKLKLNAVPKLQRGEPSPNCSEPMMQQQQPSAPRGAPTPTDTTSEWSSFLQSNPNLGRSANVTAVSSPALAPARPEMHMHSRAESRHSPAPPPPAPMQRPASDEHPGVPMSEPIMPVPPPVDIAARKPARPSRPSSRASQKQPTGRPRGRPRKKPLPEGNTSAVEDATDGDDGPRKKRVTTTRADWTDKAPFGAAPESLRVAASTSGSLRTFRPVMAPGEGPPGSGHLRDGPRAPTPVPNPLAAGPQARRGMQPSRSRRESLAELDGGASYEQFDPSMLMPQGHDARSPTESIPQSPFQGYTPEDSPADIGSSPPVPRSAPFMHFSPMPSSPILPPMPVPQPDSGFMSGGVEDQFDEEELPQTLPMQVQEAPRSEPARPKPTRRPRRAQAPPLITSLSFEHVTPGPPELLPKQSIFNPAGITKPLNKPPPPPPPQPQQPPTLEQAGASQLKRASTEPKPSRSGPSQQARNPTPAPPPADQPAAPPELPRRPSQGPASQASAPTSAPLPSKEDGGVDHSVEAPPVATTELSQPHNHAASAEPELPSMALPAAPAPRQMARAASMGSVPAASVPASDPLTLPALTLPPTSFSEAPCPESDAAAGSKSNKNFVKKQSIKEKLQKAIESGEMPPYCQNCGAIETPTWRKMWTQDHEGIPPFYEFSEKPGHVTAIDVLSRDAQGRPTKYRLVKKALGMVEDKRKWTELLLCNPCGIWLSKFKCHRPPDRWEKDASRLGQPRRKRESRSRNGRSKRARTQSEGPANPTSEAYFTTDPLGPGDEDAAPRSQDGADSARQEEGSVEPPSQRASQPDQAPGDQAQRPNKSPKSRPGSTHSRGSGTAESPIALDDDLGSTRRLLFPSPRKDGVPKILGELEVNVVKTAPDFAAIKKGAAEKENSGRAHNMPTTPGRRRLEDDDMQDLFGTPPVRPSTPPPNNQSASSGPFKTPTRPTPSHRPITRSISKSIRSARAIPVSPNDAIAQLQRTPTKTPRALGGPLTASASRKRTPRNQHLHTHFALDEHLPVHFDTPFTTTLNQLLSEANDFTAGSPAHGLGDLDLISLPNMDGDGVHAHLASTGPIDFGNFLSTDMIMPSSPPMLGGRHGSSAAAGGGGGGHVAFGAVLTAYESSGSSFWDAFTDMAAHEEDDEPQPQQQQATATTAEAS